MDQKGFIALPLIFTVAIAFWPFSPKPTTPPSSSPVILQTQTPEQKDTAQKKLEKYLTVEAALLGISDNMSLYFKDLTGASEVSIAPTRPWIPASTIKAYVVLEAFRQRRLGIIDFNQTITITGDNVVPTELETDDCPRLREGVEVTMKQLIECMVIQSDNTAYNTLIDILDRRNINATLHELGFTETVIGEKLNLDDDQYALDLNVPGRQSNTITAKDYANLFDLLYVQKIPQSDEILAIFKRQKINTMIPADIPEDTPVAHKTGEWAEASLYHDGGVIYKPNDPFILSIFTNSNDPSVVARLARVAYYQDASVVGQDIPKKPTKSVGFHESDGPIFSFAPSPTEKNVLATETGTKFPEVTAQDLGITLKDLSMDEGDIGKVKDALVTPGSIFYGYKRQFELVKSTLLRLTGRRVEEILATSANRLGEAKSALKSGNFTQGQTLLSESEISLTAAVAEAKTDGNKEAKLAEIKSVNDLHYAMLADVAKTIPLSQKEQFVDLAYNFYQKNSQEVKAPVKNSLLANPLRQQPIVGTIKETKDGAVTVQFANGQEKQMVVNDLTPIRQFNQKSLDTDTNTLKAGSKIAVIGQSTNEGVIVPQFILRGVPHEVPDKHEGVVIEINPNKKTLEILNEAGKKETIKVDNTTILQGKSTNVSIEGIKAGSYVKVFGEVIPPAKISPTSAGLSTPKISTPTPTGASSAQPGVIHIVPSLTTKPGQGAAVVGPPPSSAPSAIGTSKPSVPSGKQAPQTSGGGSGTSAPVIRATTVTVTKNSSGKNEKVNPPAKNEPKKSEQKKPEESKKKSYSRESIFTLIYKLIAPLLRFIV